MTGETLEAHVRRTVAALQEALDARREQRSLPLILEGVGLAAVATVLLVVLLWGVASGSMPAPYRRVRVCCRRP